jgi:3-deoxy-D-manno-octulosonate 8-phosphate phosphatase (KDO 8-P phosphatase)
LEPTERIFSAIGGKFITAVPAMREKLLRVKAFVLDWDGVFNSGEKTSTTGSSFSEVDSMGLNLLRYSYFLIHGQMPVTLVISGERNETAFQYCEREGLTYSFFKIAHKVHALDHLCREERIAPSEVAYFFDDVLDIPIAEKCGIRIQVNQRANPLFIAYCIENSLTDYLTSAPGGQFAVREGAEMLMSLYGNYKDVIEGRTGNLASYQDYIGRRRATQTKFFTLKGTAIEAAERPRPAS